MTLSTKWAKKTAAIIQSGEVSEGTIRSMRRIMARAINHGCGLLQATPSCTADDAGELLDLINEHNPAVTADQARKGVEWLFSSVFTPRGNIRRTEFAAQFNARDLQIIRECRANPRFDLVTLYDTTQDGMRYCSLFPVYRCHGQDGRFFDYVARAWQSGGNSFITCRG